MEDVKEIIYSWSRLNTYAMAEKEEGCYYGYDLAYNKGQRGESNFFAEYGLLLHETIEKLHNNEILAWDVDDELKRGLNNLAFKAPFKPMGKSYETALFKFFDEFDEVFKKYTILEAEEEMQFQIENIKLRGFPDLVGNHKDYGLIIGDYKSSKPYEGDKLLHNIMQLYLYSIPVYEKYGRYPDHLVYIFPREKENRERVYKFDLDVLEKTKQWVVDTVQKIVSHEGEWKPRCKVVDGEKDFYACFLCNNRRNCDFRYYVTNSDPFSEAVL